jgi:heterodisulfide reductase subunit A
VVVASCTPRTHEAIFRDTLRDAGLNQYLLEMANIRDQCSWVHSGKPEAATAKAKDLVRMIVGRSVGARPLADETVPVVSTALVIGGGLAGMTASLALAEQGFGVHLVEKEEALGGTARLIHRTLSGEDPAAFVRDLARRVEGHPLIQVHVNANVKKVDGHIGKFESTIADAGTPVVVKHGAVILASGATEKKPDVFGYGKSDKVLTQLELSEKLGTGEVAVPAKGTVVMIQCVEQRDDEHPYCSRVCCATAVKNALVLKERSPGLDVIVLYRDMRTYGFRELAYKEARQKGVHFHRFRDDNPPRVSAGGGLSVTFHDQATGLDLAVAPDRLVLAARVVPRADRETLSELLRVPLNADGFFLEAHVKLRPVDFASEGLFLCGTAHAPKFVSETISQAQAVAGRAAAVLASSELAVSGQTAWVDQDKCISCLTCVHLCPYHAPRVNFNNKAEVQSAVCLGCGSCTSDCPAKAITLRNYTDAQVFGAIRSLAEARPARSAIRPAYPENTGISKIH